MRPALRRVAALLLLAALAVCGCQRYAAAGDNSGFPCRFRPFPLVVE